MNLRIVRLSLLAFGATVAHLATLTMVVLPLCNAADTLANFCGLALALVLVYTASWVGCRIFNIIKKEIETKC